MDDLETIATRNSEQVDQPTMTEASLVAKPVFDSSDGPDLDIRLQVGEATRGGTIAEHGQIKNAVNDYLSRQPGIDPSPQVAQFLHIPPYIHLSVAGELPPRLDYAIGDQILWLHAHIPDQPLVIEVDEWSTYGGNWDTGDDKEGFNKVEAATMSVSTLVRDVHRITTKMLITNEIQADVSRIGWTGS